MYLDLDMGEINYYDREQKKRGCCHPLWSSNLDRLRQTNEVSLNNLWSVDHTESQDNIESHDNVSDSILTS